MSEGYSKRVEAKQGRGGERCDNEWVKAVQAKFMATLPNQSAPSAYFSPAKVTPCTVWHITAHSLAPRREGGKKIN